MVNLGIAEINKNPAILDTLDEVATIINKKNKEIKGYFVPRAYLSYVQEGIDAIEYQRFLARNRSLIDESQEDDTLMDGLDAAY